MKFRQWLEISWGGEEPRPTPIPFSRKNWEPNPKLKDAPSPAPSPMPRKYGTLFLSWIANELKKDFPELNLLKNVKLVRREDQNQSKAVISFPDVDVDVIISKGKEGKIDLRDSYGGKMGDVDPDKVRGAIMYIVSRYSQK